MPRSPRRAHHPRRLTLTILLVALIATITPSPTPAAPFTVHSCTTPTGTWTGMQGWTSSASLTTQGHDPGIASACLANDAQIKLDFGATQMPVASGQWVGWTFAAAPNTQIESLTMLRSFELGWPVVPGIYGRPYVHDVWHDADLLGNQLEFYFPPFNGDTLGVDFDPMLVKDGVSWDSLSLRVRCWELTGNHDCGPFRARLRVPRATIGLDDSEAPVSNVSGGNLAAADPVRGIGTLAFHASDAGGGMYRSILSVDGDEVSRQVIDAGDGGCADVEPGNGDAYEFAAPRPCPLDVSGEVHFDTRALSDGPHTFRVAVEDVAGNTDIVTEDVVTTHNAPISTLAPALGGTTAVGTQIAVGTGQWDGAPSTFGYRWLRCDADGQGCAPIAGADDPTYTLTAADAYHRLAAEVAAENPSGDATARSATSARIADADGHTAPPSGKLGAPGAPGGSGAGGIDGLANPIGDREGHVANGAGATGSARIELAFRLPGGRTATRVRSPHSRRWVLVGRLVGADGQGVANARLAAAWKIAGRDWVAHGGVRTEANGSFALPLPVGPSRQVKLVYFPFSDSRGFVASNVVRQEVLAPLTIRADRTRITADRAVRLSGRAGGGSIPRAGVLVTLQGFQAGYGWRTFRTVRTKRDGSWSTRYRFRLSHGRFGFRAVVPRQGAYPFVTTRSAAVFVTVA